MAGISALDVDVAELYAPFSSIELHAIPDSGLCQHAEVIQRVAAGEFDFDGALPVNPSGGVLCANPIAVTAMVRGIEAAMQVRGLAGEHQISKVRNALATGIGGDHQFFAAMVFSDRPRRGDDLG
jgi:acetyl-CoA C-acetyltransferase